MRDGCGWCLGSNLIIDEDDTAMLDHWGLHKMALIVPDKLSKKKGAIFKINYCPICGRKLGKEATEGTE